MAQRNTSIRVGLEGGQVVVRQLDDIGDKGERAFSRIREGTARAGTGLRAVNAAAEQGRVAMRGYAAQAGPVGEILIGMGRGGLAAAAGLAASVVAIRQIGSTVTRSTERALNFANQLQDQADAIGVNVERLQELRAAFGSSGTAAQTTDRGLASLTERIGRAANGTGRLVDIVERYGIALSDTEGRQRQTYDVLLDLVDAASQAESQTERMTIATAAFGDAGRDMVNLLSAGTAEMERQTARARELGAVLGQDLVRDAARLNTELTQIGTAAEIAFNRGLLDEMLGPLDQIREKTEAITRVTELLGTTVGLVGRNAINILERIDGVLNPRDGILAWLGDLATTPGFPSVIPIIAGLNDLADSGETVNGIAEEFEGLAFAITETGEASSTLLDNTRPFRVELEETGTAAGATRDALNEYVEQLRRQIDTEAAATREVRFGAEARLAYEQARELDRLEQELGRELTEDESRAIRQVQADLRAATAARHAATEARQAETEATRAAAQAQREASQAAQREANELAPSCAPITVDLSELFEAENEEHRHEHLCDQHNPARNQGSLRHPAIQRRRRTHGTNVQDACQSPHRPWVLRKRSIPGGLGVPVDVQQVHDTVGSC